LRTPQAKHIKFILHKILDATQIDPYGNDGSAGQVKHFSYVLDGCIPPGFADENPQFHGKSYLCLATAPLSEASVPDKSARNAANQDLRVECMPGFALGTRQTKQIDCDKYMT
jgi:hypothetical protein